MYSLFIDTHSEIIRICLYRNDEIVRCLEKESLMHHSDYLMPMIKDLLDDEKIDVHSLDEILVINGPGSFTGVRLGVTIAKMLAYTLNIKIKVLSSLDMFAYSNLKPNKIVSIKDVKGSYGALYKDNKLDGEYFYMNKFEFDQFISKRNEELIKNEVDYLKVKEHFNTLDVTNPHFVNPMYIKIIEVLK